MVPFGTKSAPFVQFKQLKNTHGGVLISAKLQAEAYNFNKSDTPPLVFFRFFKLYKWYQIAQITSYFELPGKDNTMFSIEKKVFTRFSYFLHKVFILSTFRNNTSCCFHLLMYFLSNSFKGNFPK